LRTVLPYTNAFHSFSLYSCVSTPSFPGCLLIPPSQRILPTKSPLFESNVHPFFPLPLPPGDNPLSHLRFVRSIVLRESGGPSSVSTLSLIGFFYCCSSQVFEPTQVLRCRSVSSPHRLLDPLTFHGPSLPSCSFKPPSPLFQISMALSSLGEIHNDRVSSHNRRPCFCRRPTRLQCQSHSGTLQYVFSFSCLPIPTRRMLAPYVS